MTHRRCESPSCQGETVGSVKLDRGPDAPGTLLRGGHGFVVGVTKTSPGLVVCGPCAARKAAPKRRKGARR